MKGYGRHLWTPGRLEAVPQASAILGEVSDEAGGNFMGMLQGLCYAVHMGLEGTEVLISLLSVDSLQLKVCCCEGSHVWYGALRLSQITKIVPAH